MRTREGYYMVKISYDRHRGEWHWREGASEEDAVRNLSKGWYTSGVAVGKRRESNYQRTKNPQGSGDAAISVATYDLSACNRWASAEVLLSVEALPDQPVRNVGFGKRS